MPRVQDYYQALEMEDGSRYEVGGTYRGAEIISIYAPPGGPTVIATPVWNYDIPLADIRYWCQEV